MSVKNEGGKWPEKHARTTTAVIFSPVAPGVRASDAVNHMCVASPAGRVPLATDIGLPEH